MGKIFLSHSSKDKAFVEPIADLLGKQTCVYDKYTFELGMKTIDEIFDNLDQTDIFVFFISNNSLDSEWVKQELNRAKELLRLPHKLSQIFPIIIDEKIEHSDSRIPQFLKSEYNLQRVSSYKLAYRKIIDQYNKAEFEKDIDNIEIKSSFFYGRDIQIANFKKKIDSDNPIKSAVISGIPGIGKKSFIRKALIDCKIIKPYCSPYVVSLPHNGSIEDLILCLSEAGFGEYSLEFLANDTTMDQRIDILVEQINSVQKYKEIIIIEDNNSIVTLNGDIKYWYYNAIEKSDNGIALIVSSNIFVSNTYAKKYQEVYFDNLIELEKSDCLGLLRTYSDFLHLELSQEERLYFKDCINGYPPQILFCIDMIKEKGIEYAKKHTDEIASMPEQISSMMLEKCYEECDEFYINGILSLISRLEIVPIKLINKICSLNDCYKKAIVSLKNHLLCYKVGSNDEYYKTNSFISDYVSRNRFPLPEEIQNELNTELKAFNDDLENNEDLIEWNINELRYYIKENIINNNGKWDSFLYSTILLQSVYELYNKQKYNRVKELVLGLKDNSRYEYYDVSIVDSLENYLCKAYIKTHNTNFEAEVEYFKERKLNIDYFFLKGFWDRCNGHYERAINNYKKVLDINNAHFATKRELVIAYLSIHDYEAGFELARSNYYRSKDNPYAIQAYFECLIENKKIDDTQEGDIQAMLNTIKRIHRTNQTPLYYQLLGKYEAYHENNIHLGIKYINDGLAEYPANMYLLRDKFDIFRKHKMISEMESVLNELNEAVKEYEFKGVVLTRQAVLDLFKGKSSTAVEMQLREAGFSTKSIENIINKYKA